MDAISDLTIETAVSPPIPVGGDGEPSALSKFLRLRVRGTVAGLPLSYAPYGDPPDTRWPWMVGAALTLSAVLGLAGYGAYRLARG